MVGDDGHRGWLYNVVVRLDHQRLGFGRAMVKAAERWLSEWGIRWVQLMVRETNTQVAGFYEQMGYAVIPHTVLQM
jgi:ribosomal protein S18 acetylase RimI-like enzyme